MKKLLYTLFICMSVGLAQNSVTIQSVDTDAGTIAVGYEFAENVGGFQFSISGAEITGASSGAAADNNFTVSTSSATVLGFSFSGDEIPAGSGLLTNLTVDSDYSDICITSIILSDPAGTPIGSNESDCAGVDCNGEFGGGAVLDECGVCDGPGIPDGDCDCDGNTLDECGECGGDGSTCAPGTLNINYSSDTDFGGFQFNLDNTKLVR